MREHNGRVPMERNAIYTGVFLTPEAWQAVRDVLVSQLDTLEVPEDVFYCNQAIQQIDERTA